MTEVAIIIVLSAVVGCTVVWTAAMLDDWLRQVNRKQK